MGASEGRGRRSSVRAQRLFIRNVATSAKNACSVAAEPGYELERALNSYVGFKSEKVEAAKREARSAAIRATRLILVIAAAALGLAFLLAFVLARVLHEHYQRVSTALSDRDKLLAVVSSSAKITKQSIIIWMLLLLLVIELIVKEQLSSGNGRQVFCGILLSKVMS